jgi:chorismate synthase
VKGIEFGSGFASARMKGSVHNDPFVSTDGRTSSNNAGGINGGITNGNEIVFRIAVKPTSSTGAEQTTLDFESGKMKKLVVKGRHDTCIALRIPVIVEAAAAITMADLFLIDRGIHGARKQ